MQRMKSRNSPVVKILAPLLAVLLSMTSAAHARVLAPPAVPQITEAINPAQSSAMQTGVRPEVVAINGTTIVDNGRVDDDLALDHMLLLLHRPDAQEQALDEFMDEQVTYGSPNYHNWLTVEEVAEFGPAQSDIHTLTDWLQTQGFAVNDVSGDQMTIDFSGTAGQVRQAFHTEIHDLSVNGQAHIANMSMAEIPSALAPAVVGIASLNDFRPMSFRRPVPNYTISDSFQAVVPADLATIYSLNPLFNGSPVIKGSGQTIVLLEEGDVYSVSDITTFRTTFGLPAFGSPGGPTFTQTHPGGCTDPGDINGVDGEVELDIEWAGAAAPGASLVMASCADTTSPGVLLAMQHLNSANDSARSWSLSYGFCEAGDGASLNASFSSAYQTAAARGVSVFVSSGDQGAGGCDGDTDAVIFGISVNGWASTAYNVAVGGTDFGDSFAGTNGSYWASANSPTYGSAFSYINEIPWNDSCASQLIAEAGAYYAGLWNFSTTYGSTGFCNNAQYGEKYFLTNAAGSGGPSNCYTGSPASGSGNGGSCHGNAKPSWQSGVVGIPADGVRDLPDVSLFAANGVWGHAYIYCYSNLGANLGGAACTGAPSGWSAAGGTSFASPIMAGIQALVNQKTGSSQGNPNPSYYQLAAAEYGASGSTTCNSTLGNGVASNCVFYDVTQGDIDVNCKFNGTKNNNCYKPSGTNGVLSTSNSSYQPAYKTTTGWDFATGIGTVNAANLANSWPGMPTKLVFTMEPNASYASGATITVKVSVEDSLGNVVTANTSAVTMSLSGGTGGATLGGTKTVNAVAGVATFSNLTVDKAGSGYALNATDGALTGAASSTFNITAGTASTLVFTTQPPVSAQSGTAFGATVTVEDAAGNTVTGSSASVTLTLTGGAGNGVLSGTTTINAASGVAAFSGLSVDKASTAYLLHATVTGLTPVASNNFNITPGNATKLVFTTQPPASSQSGSPFGVTITVEDAAGNTVTGSSTSIALTLSGGTLGATLSGTTTMTATAGVAVFSGLSVDKPGTGYQLNAASSGLTGAASSVFAINAGAPAQLVFVQAPQDGTANITLPAIEVAVEDAVGYIVTNDANSATIAVTSGPGSFDPSSTVSVPFVNGVATFSNLILNTAGAYTITITDTGDSGLNITSSTFNVAVGQANKLIFTTQPANVSSGSTLATIAVTELDSGNNVIADNTTSVDFTVAACGGSVDLGSAPMVSGVATLTTSQRLYTAADGLSVTATDTGATLTQNSALFSVTSNPDQVYSDGFDGCRL
jgi:Pro-kumamolisin, activation domain